MNSIHLCFRMRFAISMTRLCILAPFLDSFEISISFVIKWYLYHLKILISFLKLNQFPIFSMLPFLTLFSKVWQKTRWRPFPLRVLYTAHLIWVNAKTHCQVLLIITQKRKQLVTNQYFYVLRMLLATCSSFKNILFWSVWYFYSQYSLLILCVFHIL